MRSALDHGATLLRGRAAGRRRLRASGRGRRLDPLRVRRTGLGSSPPSLFLLFLLPTYVHRGNGAQEKRTRWAGTDSAVGERDARPRRHAGLHGRPVDWHVDDGVHLRGHRLLRIHHLWEGRQRQHHTRFAPEHVNE